MAATKFMGNAACPIGRLCGVARSHPALQILACIVAAQVLLSLLLVRVAAPVD